MKVIENIEFATENLVTDEPTKQELLEMQEFDDTDCIDNGLKHYLREIGQFPLLSLEEERELACQIAMGGETAKQAEDKLVNSNLRLAFFYAKKYSKCGHDIEDLNAMAVHGLIVASRKYDYTKGCKFSTYASYWIKNALERGIGDEMDPIRIPVNMRGVLKKVKKAKAYFADVYHREPAVDEIAAHTGLPTKKVLQALEAGYVMTSLDMKVADESDASLGELIADEKAQNPEAVFEDLAAKSALEEVLGQLKPREATILRLRYGIGRDRAMSLEEIRHLPGFKLSRERIRQIEKQAINKITKNPSLARKLQDFVS